MKELSEFLQLLAVPAAIAAAGALVVVIYKLITTISKSLKAKVSPELFTSFLSIVAFAVQAAEQAGLAGLIRNIGEEKKRYAIDYIESQLKLIGLDIDVDVIAAAIEGAIANKWHEIMMNPDGSSPYASQPNGPALAKLAAVSKKNSDALDDLMKN